MTNRSLIRAVLTASVCCILPTLVAAQTTFGRYPPGSYNPAYPGGTDPNPWPVTVILRAPTTLQVSSMPTSNEYRTANASANGNWNLKLCAKDAVSFTALQVGSPAEIQIRNDSTANNGDTGGRMKITYTTSGGIEPSICLEPFGAVTLPRVLSSVTKIEIEECHAAIHVCCTGP